MTRTRAFFISMGIVIALCIWQWRPIYTSLSLIVAHITGDMSYYQGDQRDLVHYHEALRLGHMQDYTGAANQVSEIRGGSPLYDELRGDLLYLHTHNLTGAIEMYRGIDGSQSSDRLQTKISLITLALQPRPQSSSGVSNTGSATGAADIAKKIEELNTLSGKRADYLRGDTTSLSSSEGEISRIMNSLETGSLTPHQDW